MLYCCSTVHQFTPWDPEGLPFAPLGPCRPTPWPLGTLINSRTYLAQFGLVFHPPIGWNWDNVERCLVGATVPQLEKSPPTRDGWWGSGGHTITLVWVWVLSHYNTRVMFTIAFNFDTHSYRKKRNTPIFTFLLIYLIISQVKQTLRKQSPCSLTFSLTQRPDDHKTWYTRPW